MTPYKYKNGNINNSTGGYISGSRQIQKDHKKDSSFTNERQGGGIQNSDTRNNESFERLYSSFTKPEATANSIADSPNKHDRA